MYEGCYICMCIYIHAHSQMLWHIQGSLSHIHMDGGNGRVGSPPGATPTFGNGRMRSPYGAEHTNRSELMLRKGWLLALSHTCVKRVPTFPAREGRALWS